MESVSKHKHRLTPLIILQIWIYANDDDDNDDAARASYDTKKNDDEEDAVMHNVT